MNKEQAKNQIKKIIDEQYTDLRHWGNVNPTFPQEKNKRVEEINKHIQALDIAIDSLENDDLIKRLENGECCKHSSNKVVAYNRDYLDKNLEMEFDILKTTRDTVQAMRKGASDDEVAERLAKVVEPYERKE